jgi:hypothetical protein
MKCIVCGSTFMVEAAHWPYAVGMGRNRKKVNLPTVPLCVKCHEFGQHMGDEEVIAALIELAPRHWKESGQWEDAQPHFERWLSKRQFRKCML